MKEILAMLRVATNLRIELAVLEHHNRTEAMCPVRTKHIDDLKAQIAEQDAAIQAAAAAYDAIVAQIGATAQRAESHHTRY